MRVTANMIYNKIVYDLGNLTERLKEINDSISSGKRLNRPSDDPTGAASALGLKTTLSSIDQYNRNIDLGNAWLATTEAAIQGGMDLIFRAKELAAQMATETYTEDQRGHAAVEVNQMLEELIRMANNKYQRRYIFAGYKTDTAPFEPVEDVNGTIIDVTYRGDTNSVEIKVGENNRIKIGKYGSEVFGEQGNLDYAFGVFIRLRDALQNNDVDGIRNELGRLDDVHNRMNAAISDTGAKMNRLELRKNILSEIELDLTERLSKVEDVDIIKAIMDLEATQTAYEAALAAAVEITQVNLVNYM